LRLSIRLHPEDPWGHMGLSLQIEAAGCCVTGRTGPAGCRHRRRHITANATASATASAAPTATTVQTHAGVVLLPAALLPVALLPVALPLSRATGS